MPEGNQARRCTSSEGDDVEFSLHDDGTVTAPRFVGHPNDQGMVLHSGVLAASRKPTVRFAADRGNVHESEDGLFAHLDNLGTMRKYDETLRRFPLSAGLEELKSQQRPPSRKVDLTRLSWPRPFRPDPRTFRRVLR